ncbi:MAG TPA: TIGR03435 family protein [Vicinamibacterales bacterium]|nr:TIGR03435 family protein [Vicinamibacterales bacterium]
MPILISAAALVAGGQNAVTARFEAATIKINRAGGRPAPPRVIPATGQVTITNAAVSALIQDAYGIQLPSLIVNMPDWARSQHVDVVAKAPSPAPVAVLQRMMQPLLTEYFKLAVHRETRDVVAFALMLTSPGRTGSKLKRVDDSCDAAVGTTIGFARPAEGTDQRQVCGVLPAGAGEIIAHGIDVAGLATELAPSQRRPIIDRTGLTGRFDVELKWTPDAFSATALAQRPGSTPPPGVDPAGPPLATALQDQLGLKLVSVTAPMEVLVIDRAEPLAN